jgi:hypothetical protein
MELERLCQYLEDLLQQLDISVRYEDLSDPDISAQSGLCKVKGRHHYIVDRSETLSGKVRLLSQCLKGMDLDGVYIKPAIRNLVDDSERKDRGRK